MLTRPAMPLMALVMGRLTANFTGFGSGGNSNAFMHQVSKNALWFVYLFIGKFTLVYIWSLGFTFAANRTVQNLRLTCLRQILNRSIADHDSRTPGSLSAAITTQCNSIQAALADRTGIMIQAFSMLIAAFAVAFSQSWQLTLVMLGLVFITLGLIGFIVGNDQKIEASLLRRYEDCSAIAEDALGNIKTVVAFGAVDKFLAKYEAILAQAEKEGKKRGPFVGLMFACQYFFMFIGWAIGFWLGAYLFTHGSISDPGRILSVFFAMLIGLGAIMALGPNMPSFIKAIAAAGAVFNLLDDEPNRGDGMSEEVGSEPEACYGHLELRDLSFAYPARPDRPALSNINMGFSPGTSTAIIGPSGAGKSTLISLLERWYAPTAGAVFIDDHDVSTVGVKWLRRQIALVQQEPQLFNASIFENIAYGLVGTEHENASREEKLSLVQAAAREARAEEFIAKLPKGLETAVGDQGGLLSGGQKQRLAIARALIGHRPILLMDEATSALDTENSKVIESLMMGSPNRTTLFISHKIKSAKPADRIVVLDKGRLAEAGTHEALMRADGLYKRLYDTQMDLDKDESTTERIEKAPTRSELPTNEPTAAADTSVQLDDIPEVRKRSFFVNLWKIAVENKRFWPIFLVGVLACIVTAQIFPVQAILLGRVLQVFQGPVNKVSSHANFWASMFLVVGIGALISYAVLGFFMTLLGVYLTRFYRREYFRAILLQPMDFFDRVASGALISRLSSDPSNLHDFLSVNFGLLLSIFISVISSIIIGLAFSWKFALVAIFGAMPVVFGAGFIRMKLDSSLAEATADIFENSSRFATDALSAIRTVKAFTMENTVQQSYEGYLSSTIKTLYRKTATIMLFFALSESVELLAAALAFWYGGKLLSEGETSTARFFTVFMAVVVGGQAAGALFGFSSNVGKAKIAANNILDMRDRVHISERPPLDASIDEKGEKDSTAIVEFRNVNFSYPARPEIPILKSVSLRIAHGQTVAIVGSSGSGKSTLLALLERFYSARSGSLSVFGEPISTHPLDEYRRRLAYVPQEPRLYKAGTLRENITLGVDESLVEDADILQACDEANLTDLVASLPEGINSDCSGKGIALSGGQKQRVAIARALIRNPELLLLDEPTSALDAESEKMVQETLQSIQRGQTMILVTHRLHTIKHADVIFVMSAGQIVEQGTHSTLMGKRGHYYRMYEASRADLA
ncbi:P-loop containing nucleoside triphosphate hydrolase protein [Rhizodiscina lignyota]|uniref:P-loop containing nucleoside triphosphate hydrolase protein n=1 Tax=Rhizodiscina lignyota TaxID=1504668 RepID=A0A9P4I527_9PEZI|nr:P-loop containing nucleoside triphosphate hydrolase protein [Rhizodiscina lignyota]